MKTQDIIEGLQILEKYRDKSGGYNCGAEHDVLHAYPTNRPVEQPDLDRLIELGWRQEGFGTAEDEGKPLREVYQDSEGWYCFT